MKDKKKTHMMGGLLLLILALVADLYQLSGQRVEELERGQTGSSAKEETLVLNAEGLLEDYSYEFSLESALPTEAEANAYFAEAEEEIDQSFYREGESANYVTEGVNPEESYVDGAVEAQWTYSDYSKLDPEGQVVEEGLSGQGDLVLVEAALTCGEYQETYTFGICLFPSSKSPQEELLMETADFIKRKQEREGDKTLTLPQTINGVSLSWSEEKDYITPKVLILELLLLFLIPRVKKEREKQKEDKRRQQMMLEYPDLLSNLTVLVGAGMPVKQAWNRIAEKYNIERQKTKTQKPAYEELLRTCRQMEDGESESSAYQKFGERLGLYQYHRFVRLLVQNLQKGSLGICQALSREAEEAFEERRTLARKLGEEAGTKMLLPLILMMGIIMAIVIAPAAISYF